MSEPDRSWLHHLLRSIDDELVELGAVRRLVRDRVGPEAERHATLTVLHALFAADWLRMTTFHRGLGHVLWSESQGEAVARIERDWDGPEWAFVKMTPTGANALRAMDDPPSALATFYAGTPEPTIDAEIDAVTGLVLGPAGLWPPASAG